MKMTGKKTLDLDAGEVAIILDSLAVQPFNRVAALIQKIITQSTDKPLGIVREGNEPERDAVA
jgi:hypothetical protein